MLIEQAIDPPCRPKQSSETANADDTTMLANRIGGKG
jgi:hypothetical protein